MSRLACVVEGQADVQALPVLARRIAAESCGILDLGRIEVVRKPKHWLLKPDGVESAVATLTTLTTSDVAILVLIDADDDCPAQLGPQLLARVRAARADRRVGVVLAKHEFEAWFLASLGSLQGTRGLSLGLSDLSNAEEISDAKGRMSKHMSRSYVPTLDQPALAAKMDLAAARKASSFDKLVREIQRLLTT